MAASGFQGVANIGKKVFPAQKMPAKFQNVLASRRAGRLRRFTPSAAKLQKVLTRQVTTRRSGGCRRLEANRRNKAERSGGHVIGNRRSFGLHDLAVILNQSAKHMFNTGIGSALRHSLPDPKDGKNKKGGPEARLACNAARGPINRHSQFLSSCPLRYRPASAWPRRSRLRLSRRLPARPPCPEVRTWYRAGYLP